MRPMQDYASHIAHQNEQVSEKGVQSTPAVNLGNVAEEVTGAPPANLEQFCLAPVIRNFD